MKILIEADAKEIAALISILLGQQPSRQANSSSPISFEEFEKAINEYQRHSSRINF